MTIAWCIFQYEDLNHDMAQQGLPTPLVKGFKLAYTQVNWKVVRIIFGFKDPNVAITRHNKTCYFPWTLSMQMDTKLYIVQIMQEQHKWFTLQYCCILYMLQANMRFLAFKAWWFLFDCTYEDESMHLELQLAFGNYANQDGLVSWNWCIYKITYSLYHIISYHFISIAQEKIMVAKEFAKIPNCFLTKSITTNGSSFLQQGWQCICVNYGELYICILQVVAYHQVLECGIGNDNPCREDAWTVLFKNLATNCKRFYLTCLLGIYYALVIPTYGAAVFQLHMCKLATPSGANKETHHPITINFSHPCIIQKNTKSHTKTLFTIIKNFFQYMKKLELYYETMCRNPCQYFLNYLYQYATLARVTCANTSHATHTHR